MNYAWSYALDELSNTFSSSFNQFNLGYTDIFQPSVDYGNAQFDNGHRIAIPTIWQVPFTRGLHGIAKAILDDVYTRVAANHVLPVNGNVARHPAGSPEQFHALRFQQTQRGRKLPQPDHRRR